MNLLLHSSVAAFDLGYGVRTWKSMVGFLRKLRDVLNALFLRIVSVKWYRWHPGGSSIGSLSSRLESKVLDQRQAGGLTLRCLSNVRRSLFEFDSISLINESCYRLYINKI